MRGWWESGTARIMVHFPSREENRADATVLKCSFVLPSAAEGAESCRFRNNGLLGYPGPNSAPAK